MKGTYAYTTKVSEALRARPETLRVLSLHRRTLIVDCMVEMWIVICFLDRHAAQQVQLWFISFR